MATQPQTTNTTAKPREAAEIVKEINPRDVKLSSEGFCWRELLIRMPKGMTADDLRDPKIWRKAQTSPQTSLRKLDHLLILDFDEKQIIRAVCTHATSTEAHLAIERVGTFREQGSSFYQDGVLEVFWDGSAYGVRRMADQVRVIAEGYTTESAAIAALHRFYPVKGAA
jgi:hypothetical protein